MRVSDILNFARQYAAVGIIALAVVSALFCIGYFLVYKLLMKGKKKPSLKAVLLSFISAAYILVVLGAVFLNRGNYNHSYVLQPLNSYIEAWNNWSAAGWRNIFLNILLFVPFGILIPLWGERFRKCRVTLLGGFAFSLLIESVQLITSLGIFETDDLIGNVFGAALGWGLMTLILALAEKEKISKVKILGCLSPILIAAVVSGALFTAYASKDLGNLSSAYSAKQNMKNITVTGQSDFSDDGGEAMVYTGILGSIEDTRVFADSFFKTLGTSIDPSRTIIYDETAVYCSQEGSGTHSLRIKYRGLTYTYTNFSPFDESIEIALNADEAVVREALRAYPIDLPADCSFKEIKDDEYLFTADMIRSGEKLINGTLVCTCNSDGTIRAIQNNMIECIAYKPCGIISTKDAYEKILEGKFNLPGAPRTVTKIDITHAALSYQLDSKGYYQPVYRFDCLISGAQGEYQDSILIPAAK